VRLVPEPIYAEAEAGGGTNRVVLAGTNQVYLPPRVLNFESKAVPLAKLVWDWLPKDTTYGQRFYATPDGFGVLNNVVLMGRDRTSIHQPEYCLIGSGWNITGKDRVSIPIERPVRYELPATRLMAVRQEKNPQGEVVTARGIYLYWFVAEDELTADHLKRMWRLAFDMMRKGVLQRWAYVSYFSVCPPGAEDATLERMKQFIAASVPEFQLVPAAPRREAAHESSARTERQEAKDQARIPGPPELK
jgi:hypothetical protein